MANDIIEPEEKSHFTERQQERFSARGEIQVEAAEKAHASRSKDHAAVGRTRGKDAGLDQFRHLFGPKRRG